jgi:hypothetical protein
MLQIGNIKINIPLFFRGKGKRRSIDLNNNKNNNDNDNLSPDILKTVPSLRDMEFSWYDDNL